MGQVVSSREVPDLLRLVRESPQRLGRLSLDMKGDAFQHAPLSFRRAIQSMAQIQRMVKHRVRRDLSGWAIA